MREKVESVNAIDELTGIRFFAALHVVFFHNFYLTGDFAQATPEFILRFFSFGDAAVAFFFILSGFILTYVYTDNSLKLNKPIKTFYWARVARLYPLYIFGLLLDLPRGLGYFFSNYGLPDALLKIGVSVSAYLLMLQSWHPRVTTTWNAPAWSLSGEMFFYLVFPFALAWLIKNKRDLLIGAVLYFIPFCLYLLIIARTEIDTQSNAFLVFWRSFPLLRVGEFFIGIILGKLFITDNSLKRFVQTNEFAMGFVFWFFLLLSLCCVALPLPLAREIILSLLLVPCFAVMIFLLAANRIFFTSFLRNKTIVLLGNASFALYILHQPILNYTEMLRDFLRLELSLFYFLFYLLATVIVSILCYFLIEIPFQKKIRKLKAS